MRAALENSRRDRKIDHAANGFARDRRVIVRQIPADQIDDEPRFGLRKQPVSDFKLPAQPVDATQALNLTAGVSNFKV